MTYKLTVTKYEFDNFLYPAFAHRASQSAAELSVAFDVMVEFRSGPTCSEELTAEDIESYRKNRQVPVALLQLTQDTATFTFREAEYQLLLERYRLYMLLVRDALTIEKRAFLVKLEDAPLEHA